MRISFRQSVYRLLAITAIGVAAFPSAWAADDVAGPKPNEAKLPLKNLVMFSSGVGFYEHRATINGNATVDMSFNVEEINDLLKSMVLRDLGGGRISNVTYASRDPITKTLSTFSLNLTSNPSMADLLNQARGERIELEAPEKIVGSLLGVEAREQPLDKERTVTTHYLNLLTDGGLRSVALPSVTRLKLLNDKLNLELQQALAVLALGHATDKKSVKLEFIGEGERSVEVGYIQSAPIWKTSYRLVLDEKKQPYLQGWAIVENTTEQDWNDVSLTLVSGRPISFRMNLYDPMYLDRPFVQPELFASLSPVTHANNLLRAGSEMQRQLANRRMNRSEEIVDEEKKRDYYFQLKDGKARLSGPTSGATPLFSADLDLPFGIPSIATADEVGELFRYVIDNPVTLPRRQSAMLPIVNASVEVDKLSIYNTNVHARYPLNALRMKNTTDLHLMQGPITVFDAGVYAGDAKIEDVSPGASRLISYALDLNVEIGRATTETMGGFTQIKIAKGVVHTSRKRERTATYLMKNSAKDDRVVLVEHAREPGWKVVEPEKPAETTRDLHRFEVKLAADEGKKFEVREELVLRETVALASLDDSSVQVFLASKAIGDNVRKALTEVIRHKQELATLTARKQEIDKQLAVINEEQQRIRQNMGYLERQSDLYVRYVKKFAAQEDLVEKLRNQASELGAQRQSQQAELDKYIATLETE